MGICLFSLGRLLIWTKAKGKSCTHAHTHTHKCTHSQTGRALTTVKSLWLEGVRFLHISLGCLTPRCRVRELEDQVRIGDLIDAAAAIQIFLLLTDSPSSVCLPISQPKSTGQWGCLWASLTTTAHMLAALWSCIHQSGHQIHLAMNGGEISGTCYNSS